MAVYRVDGWVHEPEDVFAWLRDHVPENQIVRQIAYDTVKGWWVKIVFKRQADAEDFHTVFWPEAESHRVDPWT